MTVTEPTPRESFPRDPDATAREQQLLDRYNAVLLAIRTIEAGERLTGVPGTEALRALWAQADAIQAEARGDAAGAVAGLSPDMGDHYLRPTGSAA